MPLAPEPPIVVIVDDDESVRSALQGLMKSFDLPVIAFASAEEFLASGQQARTRCLITDLRMTGMSGLELQAALNAARCSVPTIFITAHGDEQAEAQAIRAGAVAFVTKPFDDAMLIATIKQILQHGR